MTDIVATPPPSTRLSAWSLLLANRLAAAGFFILSALVLLALLAPVLPLPDPDVTAQADRLKPVLTPGHLLGTDHLGRDVLSRLIWGTQTSLLVGISATALAAIFGSLIGLVAGYARGIVDEAIMRVMDALLSFPSVLLALGIMAALGPGITTIIIAIAIADMPMFARITRSQVLSVRERDFVIATRALGAGPLRIIFRHIVPHITGPVAVMATIAVGHAILTEAALSFLGLGIQPPTSSWGAMMRNGFSYMERAPWLSVFTGLAILVTVLALNLVGDALRDRQDPRRVPN